MMGRVAVRDMETAELLNLEPGVQKLKIMFVVLVSMVKFTRVLYCSGHI